MSKHPHLQATPRERPHQVAARGGCGSTLGFRCRRFGACAPASAASRAVIPSSAPATSGRFPWVKWGRQNREVNDQQRFIVGVGRPADSQLNEPVDHRLAIDHGRICGAILSPAASFWCSQPCNGRVHGCLSVSIFAAMVAGRATPSMVEHLRKERLANPGSGQQNGSPSLVIGEAAKLVGPDPWAENRNRAIPRGCGLGRRCSRKARRSLDARRR